jgi:hypothetical protein
VDPTERLHKLVVELARDMTHGDHDHRHAQHARGVLPEVVWIVVSFSGSFPSMIGKGLKTSGRRVKPA